MTCPRRDKWVRPCKFEPRFELSAVQFPEGLDSIKVAGPAYLEKFRHQTYRGDVCVTCGRTVHPCDKAGKP